MQVSHLLLDILGVLWRADRGASASGQGRLGSACASFGSVLGGMPGAHGAAPRRPSLAFGSAPVVLTLRTGLGRNGLPGRRRPHRRARLGGVDCLRDRLFVLAISNLGWGQSSGITAASHPSPPKSARLSAGGRLGRNALRPFTRVQRRASTREMRDSPDVRSR